MKLNSMPLLLLAGCLLISGCATPVNKVAISAQTLSGIKRIDIVQMPEPKRYAILNIGGAGAMFGLIGALAASADANDKMDRITSQFNQAKLQPNEALAKTLAEKLTSKGYQVRVIDAPWRANQQDGYSWDFKDIKSDADAILVPTVTINGFVSPADSTDYLPTTTVDVVMLASNKKDIIYHGFHASGWDPGAKGWTVTPPKKVFASFNDIIFHTDESEAAMLGGSRDVADSISRDIGQ